MLRERLKALRTQRNVTQEQLADIIGVERSSIGKYEGKQGIIPSVDVLHAIADYFNVSTDYLLGRDYMSPQTKQAHRVPVYGVIPAGIPMEAIEDIIDYEEIPTDMTAGGKEFFALKIRGNSMSPDYLEDDVVIYQKAETCDNGDECAVIVNGEEATFKKVVIKRDGVFLQPLNVAEHEPVYYSNREIEELPVRVIGIAKELRRKK